MRTSLSICLQLALLTASVFCMSSCCKHDGHGEDSHTILVYLAADNGLYPYAGDFYDLADKGFLPELNSDKTLLVFEKNYTGEGSTLAKYYRSEYGVMEHIVLKKYPAECISTDTAFFARVLADADGFYPARHRGLILWSHGTGFLPEIVLDADYTRADLRHRPRSSFGQDWDSDEDVTITTPQMARNLGRHYDYILFDCCLMAQIEVAYDLRRSCDFLMFSPTEIMAQGYPYDIMFDPLFNDADRAGALKRIAQGFIDSYTESYERTRRQGGTITLVQTSAVDSLAAAVKRVYSSSKETLKDLDLDRIQEYDRYFRYHYFYDLDHLVRSIALPQDYAAFRSALERAVIFEAHTPGMLGLPLTDVCGLGTYVLQDRYPKLNQYYKTTDWYLDIMGPALNN